MYTHRLTNSHVLQNDLLCLSGNIIFSLVDNQGTSLCSNSRRPSSNLRAWHLCMVGPLYPSQNPNVDCSFGSAESPCSYLEPEDRGSRAAWMALAANYCSKMTQLPHTTREVTRHDGIGLCLGQRAPHDPLQSDLHERLESISSHKY